MSKTITNEQYTASVRQEIMRTIELMLSGNICFLEGAHTISGLRHGAAVEEFDPDFMVFVGIASETDHLPIGKIRNLWQMESLERHQSEIESATKWARKISLSACQAILTRFSDA